ncbi:hypothetical protein QYF36_013058 [Acer negundo]|nr:hypothetical protein QYF36_013058 [Acer negundo]
MKTENIVKAMRVLPPASIGLLEQNFNGIQSTSYALFELLIDHIQTVNFGSWDWFNIYSGGVYKEWMLKF